MFRRLYNWIWPDGFRGGAQPVEFDEDTKRLVIALMVQEQDDEGNRRHFMLKQYSIVTTDANPTEEFEYAVGRMAKELWKDWTLRL